MVHNLSLVHLLLALGAAATIHLVARGMMIGVRHDHYRPVVMISSDAKLVFLAVGIGVGVWAALEIVAAYTSPETRRKSGCGRHSAPWSVPWRCWAAP